VRRALLALKILVTVAALGAVLASADLAELRRLLANAHPGYLAAAVAALVVQTLVLAARFGAIIATLGRPIGVWFAIELTFVGVLFNQALPSAVGGDAIRTWQLRASGSSWRDAVTAVLLDRGSGVVVLALLAAAAVALESSGALAPLRAALLFVAGGAVAAVALLAAADRLPVLPLRVRGLLAASGLAAGMRLLLPPRPLGIAAASSAASHLLAALAAYWIASSLGAAVPLGAFIAAALCMLLATMIPLSYAGWGIREAGAVFLFAYLGVGAELALAISVLFGTALLVAALPGVVFWLAPLSARTEPGVRVRAP
jgi:uncharacterized membrane protein YbhN (UPF0104 family)